VFAARFFDSSGSLSTNLNVLASEIGDVRPQEVLDKFRTLASLTWLYDRVLRKTVTDAVARVDQRGRARFEEIVEHSSYDETPMVARGVSRAQSTDGRASSTMSVFGRSNSFSEGAAPTKLFQTRSEWGVVISWTEPDTGTPVYGILFSQTVCAIQALANCTAPTLLSALLASSATSPSDARAAGRTRAVCKDQHPSNHAAERGMCRSRNGTWKSIEVNCESHMNALAHKSVHKHTSVAVSGMLNLAKSVEMAGEFALLRKCVEDVAYRQMVVYRGVRDDDDRLYRQMALKVLIPNSRGSNLKRAMFLSMLPDGNLRNTNAVDLCLPFGQLVADIEEFKRDVARGVARCLCSNNLSCTPSADGTTLRSLRASRPYSRLSTALAQRRTHCMRSGASRALAGRIQATPRAWTRPLMLLEAMLAMSTTRSRVPIRLARRRSSAATSEAQAPKLQPLMAPPPAMRGSWRWRWRSSTRSTRVPSP